MLLEVIVAPRWIQEVQCDWGLHVVIRSLNCPWAILVVSPRNWPRATNLDFLFHKIYVSDRKNEVEVCSMFLRYFGMINTIWIYTTENSL